MANTSLYPPTIPNMIPAAEKLDSTFSMFFPVTLSKFSTALASEIKGYHLSIKDKITGRSIVNIKDSNSRYRRSGIILVNGNPFSSSTTSNISFYDNDVYTNEEEGFTIGGVYQVQIRLSLKAFDKSQEDKQTKWLSENAQYFSEWSTVCTFKVIGKSSTTYSYPSNLKGNDFFEVHGIYNNEDSDETLYSYQILLENDGETYDSGEIRTNKYTGINAFDYKFKQPLVQGLAKLTINLTTKNLNVSSLVEEISIAAPPSILVSSYEMNTSDTEICNEEGCNIIQEKENAPALSLVELYRREDGSTEWDKIYTWNSIFNKPYIDKTIESGKRYFYATVENGGSSLRPINTNGTVNYLEYAYLVGDEGQQLKLMLDNTMNSFSYNIIEQKIDTIGGKYPVITRNGNVKYRTFPVGCIITFNTDDFGSFLRKWEYNDDNEVAKEKAFRDAVMDFLYDGKPKLYKSPTEGNIIIRLTNITFQPSQSLGRKVYSFTATAYEIADNTVENYEKFGFLKNRIPDNSYIHKD